jgi:hypothetical protein
VWRVAHVPTVDDRDRRQLHRELIELKAERTELLNRIKSLLAGLGLSTLVNDKLTDRLGKLRQWDNAAVPPALQARILREFERWQLVVRQISELEAQRVREIPPTPRGADVQADQPQGDRSERRVVPGSRVFRLATDSQSPLGEECRMRPLYRLPLLSLSPGSETIETRGTSRISPTEYGPQNANRYGHFWVPNRECTYSVFRMSQPVC